MLNDVVAGPVEITGQTKFVSTIVSIIVMTVLIKPDLTFNNLINIKLSKSASMHNVIRKSL